MFKERLELLLKEKGISKKVLSDETGIPTTTMWGWVEKNQQPLPDKLVKLADYFEVTTDYLLGRENENGVVSLNANLSAFENNLLLAVRNLTRDDQNKVYGFAKALDEKK